MESIHKRGLTAKGQWLLVPTNLYPQCYIIFHNLPMSWGLFKTIRNIKRAKLRRVAWAKIVKGLKEEYCTPSEGWGSTKINISHMNWRRDGATFVWCKELV